MYQTSEEKESNNTVGTAGAHVEDTPPPEESTATPIVERLVYIVGALFGKPLNIHLFQHVLQRTF